MKIRVLLYEDKKNLRESLTQLINLSPHFVVVAAFNNCSHVEEDIALHHPALILMDIDMPEVNGLEGLKRIRKVNEQVNIVMLTVFEDNDKIFESIRNGANGYLLKKISPDKLIESLLEVMHGGAPMTPGIARQVLSFLARPAKPNASYHLSERENTVLKLLVDGFSYKMIGAEMFISIDTVRSHIRNIYEKLQVHSRGEAVAKATKDNIV